jgi:hypothetical protein
MLTGSLANYNWSGKVFWCIYLILEILRYSIRLKRVCGSAKKQLEQEHDILIKGLKLKFIYRCY